MNSLTLAGVHPKMVVQQDGVGAAKIPPHLAVYEFDNLEELLGQLAETAEDERRAIWRRADMCAVARYLAPDDRGLTGTLAEVLSCSRQQVRRYIALATTYPPVVETERGAVQLRDYSRPVNLYLDALKAEHPVAVVLTALDEGWSPRQLREHLRDGTVKPTEWRELMDYSYPGDSDPEEIVTYVNDAVTTAFQVAQRNGAGPLMWVRVRVEAMYGQDEKDEAGGSNGQAN